MKTINSQIQESQQNPGTRNMKKMTSRYIVIKLLKTNDNEKILKAAGEKDIFHRGNED